MFILCFSFKELIVSVNVSLNLKAVVPKSRSLSVIGCNAAVTNFNSFAPAALKIMLLSVAKFISLSASLPIAKAAFLRDVIDVWLVPNTKSNVLSPSYVTGVGGTTGHPSNGRTPYLVENTIDVAAINGDSGAAQNDVLRVLDIPAETLVMEAGIKCISSCCYVSCCSC